MPLNLVLRSVSERSAARVPASPRRGGSPGNAAGPEQAPASEPSLALLSPREREVCGLVARGLSNHDIATALVVTDGSAANYVQRILTKLGFRSRAQIAVWATRHGLADAPATDQA
jgi:DNA-binding NarL/FixJ family response regulator